MSDDVRARAEALCDYLDKTSGGEEWKGASLVRQLRAALAAPVSPPAPRGEAVAWGVMGTAGLVTDDTGCPCAFRNEADAREALDEWRRASSTLSAHYRVVALVPQHKEP